MTRRMGMRAPSILTVRRRERRAKASTTRPSTLSLRVGFSFFLALKLCVFKRKEASIVP